MILVHQTAFAAAVETESGFVQGVADSSVTVFKGVPFATPPIGRLRWRPPQLPAAWQGVRESATFPPRCPQIGAYPPASPEEPTSEDCLYLNVWVPAESIGKPLPVMVWLYGGGLENGSASVPLYWGDRLTQRGVIVVTANYRLGVLGFLAHPALSQESELHVSGNYGLLDQIAALKWVHRNIAAFGGDPGRVTVFGQSSGSMAVSALIASPLAKGLFQHAIGQSGGLFEPFALAPEYWLAGAEAEGVDFVRRSGAATIAQLREKPVEELLKVVFHPHFIVDGIALRSPPYDVYVNGAENDVDILVGSNASEGGLFLADRAITVENYSQILSADFPPILVRLLAPRPGNSDATAHVAAAQFEGDMRFRWDMWTWARLAASTGSKHVYFYQFSRTPPVASGSKYFGLGATHGMEMPYVFGHLDPGVASWTSADRQLSDAVQSYWTNFAKRGDPNGMGLPAWSDFRSSPDLIMTLGDRIQMEPLPKVGSLRSINRLYWAARAGAMHPVATVLLSIAAVLVLVGGSVLGYRRWRRWLRTSEARTATT